MNDYRSIFSSRFLITNRIAGQMTNKEKQLSFALKKTGKNFYCKL